MNTIVSQALATGMPVITTGHSGLPEQVVDGMNGMVVPEGAVAALAERILFLMEHAELWPAMGRSGRAHVAAHYDAAVLIERQIGYYHSIIQRS